MKLQFKLFELNSFLLCDKLATNISKLGKATFMNHNIRKQLKLLRERYIECERYFMVCSMSVLLSVIL